MNDRKRTSSRIARDNDSLAATSIKLARQAKATMIVLGTYTVTTAPEDPQDKAPKGKPVQGQVFREALVR